MATVFDQITAALSGNDATVRVNAQTGNLLGVGSLVDALSGHPPAEVVNLRKAFGSIALPDFPLTGFVTRIGDIRDALPTDVGATLSTALGPMARIDGDLGGALAASLRSALVAFEKVGALSSSRTSLGRWRIKWRRSICRCSWVPTTTLAMVAATRWPIICPTPLTGLPRAITTRRLPS
jgi:hypothetical protein